MLAIFFILIPFAEGISYLDMTVSIYGDVSCLCLVTCEDPKFSTIFARQASQVNIVVSTVNINELGGDFSKFDACVTKRLPVAVLVRADCESFEEVMNYASGNMLLDTKRKWLIISSNNNETIAKVGPDNLGSKTNTDDKKILVSEVNVNKSQTVCGSFTNNSNDIELKNTKYNEAYSLVTDSDVNTKENDIQSSNTDATSKVRKERGNVFAVFSKLNISVDASITYAGLTDDNTYELYEIINFGKIQGGPLLIKKNDICSNGLHSMTDYTYYNRWDFSGLNMRIVVVMSPVPEAFNPEIILGRGRDPRIAVVTQIGTQIIQTVAETHNIKLAYTIVDRWVGDFQRNGTYAVTNALFFREADISPIIRFVPPFVGKLDLVSTSLTSIETKFYYRIPSSGPGNFENQFLTPLTPAAWWGVVGLCVACGGVLLTSSLFEGRPFSLAYSFFSVFALVCQQFFEDTDDKGIKKTSSARKITILVTGMSCVLIYNYYTSSVVSWLLSGPPPSINSLLELINSPLQPIFEDIGYTQSWLQLPDYYYNKRNAEDEDKLKKKMFKQIKKMSVFRTVDEGIELVKKGGYAYHTETNGANDRISRTFDQRELCDMGSLQVMEKTLLFAAVQQHSPYKEFFNWSFMRLNERGIISCIRARMASQESTCEGSSPRALALGGAAPAFVLLGGGYVLGTLIMMMERWHYRHQL